MYIQLYQGITAGELVIASAEQAYDFLALLHRSTPSICGDHDIYPLTRYIIADSRLCMSADTNQKSA